MTYQQLTPKESLDATSVVSVRVKDVLSLWKRNKRKKMYQIRCKLSFGSRLRFETKCDFYFNFFFQASVGVSGPGGLWVPGPAGPAGCPEHASPPQNPGAGVKSLHSCFLLPRLCRGPAPAALLSGLHVDLPPGEGLVQGSGPDERWDCGHFITIMSLQQLRST